MKNFKDFNIDETRIGISGHGIKKHHNDYPESKYEPSVDELKKNPPKFSFSKEIDDFTIDMKKHNPYSKENPKKDKLPVKEEIQEDVYSSIYHIKTWVDGQGKTKTRKIRPHRVSFKNSKIDGTSAQDTDFSDPEALSTADEEGGDDSDNSTLSKQEKAAKYAERPDDTAEFHGRPGAKAKASVKSSNPSRNTYSKSSKPRRRKSAVMEGQHMTPEEKLKRERIIKGMKKNIDSFKAKYGKSAKDVMYATATNMAINNDMSINAGSINVSEEILNILENSQLDEISKETIVSYLSKAKDDTKNLQRKHDSQFNTSRSHKVISDKMLNRDTGIKRATKKLGKEVEESYKFHNIATSQHLIKNAQAALDTNPNMFPGSKAGFKSVISAHKRHIERALRKETNKKEEEMNEGMMDYSDFVAKIAAHKAAGSDVVDTNYSQKHGKAHYTVVDKEGTARKITHTEKGSSMENLGSHEGSVKDVEKATNAPEKRGRGRPAGSLSGGRA